MLNKNNLRAISMIVCSSLLNVFAVRMFMEPSNVLPSGFTGLATLLNIILAKLNISLDISVLIVLLNLPVALLCLKSISFRFVSLSFLQISLVSLFLYLPIQPLFDDIILNTIFGGVMQGLAVVLSLKVDASTGGTDFISIYVSNKLGKGIWGHVFVFNVCLYLIFGFLTGFTLAGYSIITNLVMTVTISKMYYRYSQITLQITTSKPETIIKEYTEKFKHGISVLQAKGGYSQKDMSLLHTVVSRAEVPEIVILMSHIDDNVIINSFKTEQFYGNFYRPPIS